ncbi:MAG TPA: DNA-processing protein DprA [Candidatus Pullichristensenella avicola]|nr:DNA-processing protein DprA [Candidatus Pullichristensenella avicola]
MHYGDDAFAAMLLTVALSADRAEYARPLSTAEFVRVLSRARSSAAGRLGGLLHADIGGLMMLLNVSEEEAYRLYTLLHRGVQLTYTLEGFQEKGVRVITCFDDDYPPQFRARMGAFAPPTLFFAGNRALLEHPAVAVMGISGVRTTPEARGCIESIAQGARDLDYGVVTGGELGVSRVAAGLVAERGGALIDVPAGGLLAHIGEEPVRELLCDGRAAVLSLEHPEALFTVAHAIARNKLIFSIAQAAFVFNTDGKRGETDALKRPLCDWVYAYTGCAANRALLARGAQPFSRLDLDEFHRLSARWKTSFSEQINMFDML